MAEKQKTGSQPSRPQLRRWFDPADVSWLVLEPAKIALIGAAICATLCMVYLFVRQQMGLVMDPMAVLFRAALTFVISYTLTGAFVYYLLWVAEKELTPEPPPEPLPPPVTEGGETEQEEAEEPEVDEP